MSLIKTISGAAVLLAFAPSVLAVGSATVINNCGFDIYYASVAQNAGASMQLLQGSYTEQYSDQGVGISIKLAMANSLSGPVSQFELTWQNDKINYDLSNINGYPFSAGGMELVPSTPADSSNPTCVVVNCPAGESTCTAAYNQPDDTATKVCSDQTNLVLTMCPGGSSNSTKVKREPLHGANVHLHNRFHSRQFK